jgi:hypothetical protein
VSSSRIVKEEYTMTGRSTHWKVHYPGEVYAGDLRFYIPQNEQQVRQYLRDVEEIPRLPNGLEVWIA